MFPNGNVYRDRVQSPNAVDILRMEDEEIGPLEETVVVKGEELTQEGNTFKGLSSTLQSYAHFRNIYKKVFRDS